MYRNYEKKKIIMEIIMIYVFLFLNCGLFLFLLIILIVSVILVDNDLLEICIIML